MVQSFHGFLLGKSSQKALLDQMTLIRITTLQASEIK
jgi:hypothetical protein